MLEQRIESINDEDLEIISFMCRAAYRAYEVYEAEILKEDVFSSSEAQRLGALLAAYHAEILLHLEDSDHVPGMTKDLDKLTDPTTSKSLHDDRIMFEVAIHHAQLGRYGYLKNALNSHAQYLQGEGQSTDDHLVKFGKKLEVLVNSMHPSGEKFKLPLPAWVDERFVAEDDFDIRVIQ